MPIGVVALIAMAALLHLPKPSASGRVDILGGLLATMSIVAVMLFASWGGARLPWSSPVILVLIAGAGVGLFVQVALLAGQNAVDYQHLGVATGAQNFFKSVGGAFGAALFGAIFTHGLARGDAVHAFQSVFRWTVPFMALAFVLALVMREKPLSDTSITAGTTTASTPTSWN